MDSTISGRGVVIFSKVFEGEICMGCDVLGFNVSYELFMLDSEDRF